MTVVEVTSRDTLEKAYVKGELGEVVGAINMASAKGLRFLVMDNAEDNDNPIAIEIGNITQMRQKDDMDAYIG